MNSEHKGKLLFSMIDASADIVFAVFFVLFLEARSYDVKVLVQQGTLIGTQYTTVFDGKIYYAFYGVPYAQAPVGKLRFKDPRAPKKWKRPFDARTEHRGACAQAHIVHKHGVYGYEDCLHLNIYTPCIPKDVNPKKAVIIWVHGYAFTSSFSHIFGGDFFIENDVILITVTHRIGAFGFLKLNQSNPDANMGLKDIVMALKWIKRNIKIFGGDRNQITVMGNGSAATFLSLLLTAKSSKLFERLILQSGTMYSPSLFLGHNDLEKARLQEALNKRGVKEIKYASTNDIVAASQNIYTNLEVIQYQKPLIPFLPIIESESNRSLLTKTPQDFFDTIQNLHINKRVLIGFNSQEGISEIIPFIHNPHLLQSLAVSFKYIVPFADGCQFNSTSQTYKAVADKIKSKYFRKGISIESLLKYTSDLCKYPVNEFIRKHIKASDSGIYVYKFNYNGNFNAVKTTSMAGINVKVKGASNGDEICYLLKCEPLWEYYVKIYQDINDRDRIFIKQITELWSNFAKTGEPTPYNYRGNITWPPTTLEEDNVLGVGRDIKIINIKSEKKMFSFWNAIYNKYYSPEHCKVLKHEEL